MARRFRLIAGQDFGPKGGPGGNLKVELGVLAPVWKRIQEYLRHDIQKAHTRHTPVTKVTHTPNSKAGARLSYLDARGGRTPRKDHPLKPSERQKRLDLDTTGTVSPPSSHSAVSLQSQTLKNKRIDHVSAERFVVFTKEMNSVLDSGSLFVFVLAVLALVLGEGRLDVSSVYARMKDVRLGLKHSSTNDMISFFVSSGPFCDPYGGSKEFLA